MQFKPHAIASHEAVAIICDLEGFSKFFNYPDAQLYVGGFLNKVLGSVSANIKGGSNFEDPGKRFTPLPFTIVQSKFMGDGELYILTMPPVPPSVADAAIVDLTNRLRHLNEAFPSLLKKCADDVPIAELPSRIRFGLARGTVYELEQLATKQKEYIGFPLNLASRLQRYCPDLAFIASARIKFPPQKMESNGYKKVIATRIRGFPRELVLVSRKEYDLIPLARRQELFEESPS